MYSPPSYAVNYFLKILLIITSLKVLPCLICKPASAVAHLFLYRNCVKYPNFRKSPKCHLTVNEVFPTLESVRLGHAYIFSGHYPFSVPILMAGV